MTCCKKEIYDRTFDLEHAEKDLADYLSSGVKKNSAPLLKMLKKLPLKDKTIMDVGGGIGALTFELFKQGIRYATHIDISTAYVEYFQKEAEKRGLSGRSESHLGTLREVYDKIQSSDLVLLDKVICCYADYEELVTSSTEKAIRWYAYSTPRNIWWVRLGEWIESIKRWISGKPFKTYLHPTDSIEKMVSNLGFQKIEQIYQREWLIALYERTNK